MPGWNFADVWETVAQQIPLFPRVKALVYFDTPDNQRGWDSRVDVTPDALRAYRRDTEGGPDVLLDLAESSRERLWIRELLSYLHQIDPRVRDCEQVSNSTCVRESRLPRGTRRTWAEASSRHERHREGGTAGRPANGRPERPLFAKIRHRAWAGPPSRRKITPL